MCFRNLESEIGFAPEGTDLAIQILPPSSALLREKNFLQPMPIRNTKSKYESDGPEIIGLRVEISPPGYCALPQMQNISKFEETSGMFPLQGKRIFATILLLKK